MFPKLTFSPRLPSSSLPWATGFAVLVAALQLLPEDLHRALWYERAAVAGGEYWRLFTGNLVHLGWQHLWLNLGALLIGIWIFYPARTPVAWTVALVASGLGTNLGLWFFVPEIQWCIGLSGALHGLLLIGAIDWVREGERLGFVFLTLWIAKLAWEQWQGPLPFAGPDLGAPVVTQAHLWGSVGGLVYLAGESLRRRRRRAL